MIILPGSITYDLIVLIGTFLVAIYAFYKYRFNYWKRQGLEFLPPSFPFGNCGKMMMQQLAFGQQFNLLYKQMRAKGFKQGGAYLLSTPVYIPCDLETIKNVLIKDFSHFVDRGFYVNEENDPLSGNLFSLEGNKWKNLRAKLTATFTSGKMKMMFDTITTSADELISAISEDKGPTDIKEWLARFTVDVISSCAFGLESNAIRDPNTDFRMYGKRIIQNTTKENIVNLFIFSLPFKVLDYFKVKGTKPDVEDFFLNLVKKTVEYREKNNISRKDFLHLLIQLKNRGKLSDDGKIFNDDKELGESVININELAAQVFVFFLAGFETSSTMMNFALYELSKHQNYQEKLREEIKQVLKKHNGKLTYDGVQEMTYLDQVVNETLRMYPALPLLNRVVNNDYVIPEINVTIHKGTMVVVPIQAIQNDREYFENPEIFDPERFNEENKQSIPPMAFIPFGDGPRNCIGLRFGLMQTKVGLIKIIQNFHTKISRQTIEPLEYDTTSFTIATESTLYLDLKKIN